MPRPYGVAMSSMKFDPDKHHRRSIRLPGHDYSSDGWYFVTVCAAQRGAVFGKIETGVVQLHPYGRIVEECWRASSEHFRDIVLDEFIVMPDHFHGIVISTGETNVGARHASPLQGGTNVLGDVVGSFKSAVTRRINARRVEEGRSQVKVWQRNFWEHIIRDEDDLNIKRRYILENPTRWQTKRDYPA